MRVVQYYLKSDSKKSQHVGIKLGQEIIDLATINPAYPNNLLDVLRENENFVEDIKKINLDSIKQRVRVDDVHLLAPITNSDKVICTGMNYKDHCEEQGCPVPVEPIFFSKWASTLIGPFDPLHYPEQTEQLDYEVELAFIVGKKGKNIPLDQAMKHVFGYAVTHDVSARDWQFNKNGGQWLMGKSMDDFCPIGPEIVTTDELKDPNSLPIKCRVNGVVRQDSNTNQLVHKIDGIVTFLSKAFTLLPGDVVLTGTPPGVGVFSKPPLFLKRGDVIECEIGGIGIIRNEVI